MDKIKIREILKKNNDNTYDNFNIKDKEPKYIIKYYKASIWCSTVLKDGRFVTGSNDGLIKIYNNNTFILDLIIKAYNSSVTNIIQLSSGELVSCSYDNTIKILSSKYKVIQILKYHTNWVYKIIELKNEQLVSCSHDKSIIFYKKINNKYIKNYHISTNGRNGPIIQTKDNEICYYEYDATICFYNLIKKNIIKKINNISVAHCINDSLLMISKDLLLITGYDEIYQL